MGKLKKRSIVTMQFYGAMMKKKPLKQLTQPEIFWFNVRYICATKDIILKELAYGIGIHPQNLYTKFNCKYLPRLDTALAIAKFLDVTVETLLKDPNEKIA